MLCERTPTSTKSQSDYLKCFMTHAESGIQVDRPVSDMYADCYLKNTSSPEKNQIAELS